MTHTTDSTKSMLIRELGRLVASLEESGPQPVAESIQSMMAAVQYGDIVLAESALEATREAFRKEVTQTVGAQLMWASEIRTFVQEMFSRIGDRTPLEPDERLDKLGEATEAIHRFAVDRLQDILTRSGEIMKSLGIDLIDSLYAEMKFWDDFKINVLGTWPWSNQPPLPVDREMVAASQAAIERGEGIPLEDLIRSYSGN